ncbi:MAG: arylesterase [Sideroxydans sp.]|jgi:acyl-CoA thioesterase-1
MNTFLKIISLVFALALANSACSAQNILVFGDSLSAGYGIARTDSWVNLLQLELKKTHPQFAVINASISGETTAGGLRRVGRALQEHQPAVVILELGANDGLRGSALAEIEKNLHQIIDQTKKAKSKVLLLGIRLPPNYGLNYTRRFQSLYPKLAQQHRITLVPFMLEGIGPEQFQADNLHPDASAQPRIMRNIFSSLEPLL